MTVFVVIAFLLTFWLIKITKWGWLVYAALCLACFQYGYLVTLNIMVWGYILTICVAGYIDLKRERHD